MALKQVLVHLNQFKGSGLRLRLAMELARRHCSHLSALFVDELNSRQLAAGVTAELGLAAAPDIATLRRSIAQEIGLAASQLQASLESFKATRGIEADWRQSGGFSDVLLREEAPYADLTVIGQVGAFNDAGGNGNFCENLLCDTGGPLVLVPDDAHPDSLGQRIVLAWDASAPAMRALNLALPLIEKSEHTTIVNVGCGPVRLSKADLYRLAERLNRHGTAARVIQIDASSHRISELLQSQAEALGADLIVCGAFGHHRLKEHLLGGVTRDLLQRSTVSLFVAR